MILKRFEVVVRGPSEAHRDLPLRALRRGRYSSYQAALARLDFERCVGEPGAYGIVVLPTRRVVCPPQALPARTRDFYPGETCQCPRCGGAGPTHRESSLWAALEPAGELRRRECLTCGAIVGLPRTRAGEVALLAEPCKPARPKADADPPLKDEVQDEGTVAADLWPRFVTV